MPTEIIKDVGGGANHYPSLTAWEAGEQGNLVAADQIRTARCFAYTDAGVLISGSYTDPTRYLQITVDPSARHAGAWDDTKFRIRITGSTQTCIDILDDHVRISGVQFDIACSYIYGGRGVYYHPDSVTQNCELWFERCIVRGTGYTGSGNQLSVVTGIYWWPSTSARLRVSNSVFWDCRGPGASGSIGVYVAGGIERWVYNCTAYNCQCGFRIQNKNYAAAISNCLAQSCEDGFDCDISQLTATNNASDIAGDAPGDNPRTGTAAFVNAAGGNFHLLGSDTVARNRGATLSGDADYPITVDIDGETRSGTWDIGADEQFPLIHQLSGAASGAASATALLLGKAALAGAAVGVGSSAAALSLSVAMSASASGYASAVAGLAVSRALSGVTEAPECLTSSLLSILMPLDGVAEGASSAIGALDLIAAIHALAGAAAGTSEASGALTLMRALGGSAAAEAGSATAALTLSYALSGAAEGASSAIAALTRQTALAGAAAGLGSATGWLYIPRPWPAISGLRVQRWSGAR